MGPSETSKRRRFLYAVAWLLRAPFVAAYAVLTVALFAAIFTAELLVLAGMFIADPGSWLDDD